MRALPPMLPLLAAALFAVVALAGCVTDPAPGPTSSDDDMSTTLQESFKGIVVSANTPAVAISPDQAGDVERGFFVHEDTRLLTLDLRTNQHELLMDVRAPGCHDRDCSVEVATEDRHALYVVERPQAGPWEVLFFLRDTGAEEVYYELQVTKDQDVLHDPEYEVYDGAAVALHLGAIRISPDQLGDVFREFWVHEGTGPLTIDVTTSEDIQFVVGQSFPSRDRASEEGWETVDGRLALEFDAPRPGGWYFIIFHEPEGPGVAQPEYTVAVTKHRDLQEQD